ncbi:DUF424 family protein [Candidatus Micrarchaeota archaeon]|nr:DUF424 family protein [Candidatus Micrarchaeota archaeon]
MIMLKVHNHPKGRIIALCDEDLIGKIFDNGIYHIDLVKHQEFYNGERAEIGTITELLAHDFSSVNAIGNEAVSFLISKGFVSKDNVKFIGDIPIVHIYKI